jgi:hypothetical protein
VHGDSVLFKKFFLENNLEDITIKFVCCMTSQTRIGSTVCGESRTYGKEGVRVYSCSVVVGPTHPICSMIYGSTGATHFDQLAKILIGYESTGARSSGIFMGILFIAVGSLFKITAVPFQAAVGRTAPYR